MCVGNPAAPRRTAGPGSVALRPSLITSMITSITMIIISSSSSSSCSSSSRNIIIIIITITIVITTYYYYYDYYVLLLFYRPARVRWLCDRQC